ncbi:hypothetical protein ASPCAL14298 [Aspergillus calidoustus]|uniref:Xylanolytic transcriptional activator regulatory domain-containing protein n=1 Tax=Aspergillus calidoustus TaxID=454130 RepID=A0A0U5GGP7_ASPCI|nr:hypothetical protein ASPCAL14298 [Aspergillus calidoustus]
MSNPLDLSTRWSTSDTIRIRWIRHSQPVPRQFRQTDPILHIGALSGGGHSPASAADAARSAAMALYRPVPIVPKPVSSASRDERWDQCREVHTNSRLHYLEQRVRELEAIGGQTPQSDSSENSQSPFAPAQLEIGPIIPPHPPTPSNLRPNQEQGNPVSAAESPAVSVSSRITRDQPLAHEVGLLSLSNTTDPKYLGPSSGVSFARLIYESVPQSQGLPLSFLHEEQHGPRPTTDGGRQGIVLDNIPPINLPSLGDCQQFVEAYFDGTPFFPLISQDAVYSLLGEVQRFNETSTWCSRLPIRLASAQLLLVLSLGARFLEARLGADYSSRDLFLAGMANCSHVNLHDTVEGVQVLLLMVLHSFYNPESLNAWYLIHTIIASCLDLGLQRRDSYARSTESQSQRTEVFWCAYSMDRTLTTILGRPLTLRDEAIDQPFPGLDSNEVEEAATRWHRSSGRASDGNNTNPVTSAYMPYIYSLRFDRIVAEIKLMIYRVSRSPSRFPWPDGDNLATWQAEAEHACTTLIAVVQARQQGRPSCGPNPLSGTAVRRLEIKYHQCIMLLYRPSPQIPHPSLPAIQACFNSAMQIIKICAELHRFSNLECSWLTAHSIFVAAITVLYCLWTYPAVCGLRPMTECLARTETALRILSFLGQWWSVAQEPCQKLSRLIALTREGPHSLMERADPMGNPSQGAAAEVQGVDGEGRSLLIDELGVLRDLFDLGWLNDFGLDTAQPASWDSNLMDGFETSGHDAGLNG